MFTLRSGNFNGFRIMYFTIDFPSSKSAINYHINLKYASRVYEDNNSLVINVLVVL